MRAKMFVEILEESADKSKLLVRNEVYNEPIWVEKVKVNRQNQVIEFILSQETRKQHRTRDVVPPVTAEPSSSPESVVNITSSSAALLDGFLSGDSLTNEVSSQAPTQNKHPEAQESQTKSDTPPWIQAASASPTQSTPKEHNSEPESTIESAYFSSMTEPAISIVEDDAAYEPLSPDASITASDESASGSTSVTHPGAAALESELKELYDASMQSRQRLGAIGRGAVDLEPHMEICDGRLCLVIPWREPITKQEGSIAVSSPQARDGTFSLPAWKLPLLAKQLKDQITTMSHPVYLKIAGFDFFLD